MTDAPDLSLAAEFPAATREAWLTLVEAALKGASFDKRLVSRTYDGLRIEPLYARAADARPIAGRPAPAPWQVLARIDHPDAGAANAEARHELENGATGLSVVFAGAIGAHGYGLEPSAAAIARAFDGIHLDAGIAVECDLGPRAEDAARALADLVGRTAVAPAATRIRFALDPLGLAAVIGCDPAWERAAPEFARLVADLAGRGFAGPFACADARPIHAAGGAEAQELAFALATATAGLRALEAHGIALDEARRMIFFRLAADTDQLLTMAKLRALRRLWARVEQACGLTPQPAFVSAETAWRMMTRRDPWVNMLRTTMAIFAAGVGGADAVTVLPFTTALGLPDRFARRMARNSQLILLEESNLAKVADPAAGSGAIESLTTALCAAAWTLFQEIEAAGGAAAALAAGLIQRKVAEVRAARTAAVARRRDALTGTSEFPQLAETPVAVLDVARVPSAPEPPAFEPLPSLRLAEPFEQLRDRSDQMLATTGVRPRVFLANLGPLAAFAPRAGFAGNLFEAGGIEALSNQGFADLDAMAAAFTASGAPIACLCSSDGIYGTQAVAAARALGAAGARRICLAGRPGEHEAAQREAGIDTYVYAGCDVPATLTALYPAPADG
ncbi:MAG: methylmalonyl-CoA mutase subunit beta [Xanthobacteraceae bacterium]